MPARAPRWTGLRAGWRASRTRLLELWLIGLIASVGVTLASLLGYLDAAQARSLDVLMRLRAVAPVDDVVIVAIDDAAFSALGERQPLPRDYLARVIRGLRRSGAAVVGLDRNPAIEELWKRPDFLGVKCDLTHRQEVEEALDKAARRFGGIDMLVLNAGIFPSSQPIQDIAAESWRAAMTVNVEANLLVMQACHRLLKLAPRGGRVVVIGSKNVPAPGPGAAAYSASKAALNQLARVAALEWAKDGIRINSLHPNAVYDTALWTDEVLASRAKAYNLTVEQYKKNNLLKTEVASRDVAELAAEMCGPLFAKTTAAQVPVDGGNERVV